MKINTPSKVPASIIKGIDHVYHLTGTLRYNNQFMLRQENVAEHSYMVASIVHILCETYSIDPAIHFEALKYAIVHDLPEAVTGDILASTKANVSGLSDLISELELKVIEEHFPFLKESYADYNAHSYEFAYVILKLADYLSVQSCMMREKKLGNSYPFVDTILRDVDVKIEKFYKLFGEHAGFIKKNIITSDSSIDYSIQDPVALKELSK